MLAFGKVLQEKRTTIASPGDLSYIDDISPVLGPGSHPLVLDMAMVVDALMPQVILVIPLLTLDSDRDQGP